MERGSDKESERRRLRSERERRFDMERGIETDNYI